MAVTGGTSGASVISVTDADSSGPTARLSQQLFRPAPEPAQPRSPSEELTGLPGDM
jgi:hypothetical protein